ncbi:MFS transporter [Petrocella sp. FN5]|uniref:MFS transporter n=1 Tax=Petrocella sp. FN5 TaxID=3032002 RepID=UPI0023DA3015|nr:MFS transporter [Petrocella sp. FN5]MDF1618270.1 MFS transporter [Petrocella sp. FN5]
MIKDNQEIITPDPSKELNILGEPNEAAYPEHWIRKTVLFLLSQSFSLFGSALVQFAIIWHITLTTQSGVMMTISTVFAFLPQLFISLFAGVWADRYNRKTLMILSDFLIAGSTLVLAILFYLGYGSLWALFIVSGIRSLGTGIQTPAVNAFLPQIVPKAKLMKVNGINNSVGSLIMLIAPVISGILLTSSTLEVTFFIDVITATFAILILFALKVPPHEKALSSQQEGYFDDLKAGLLYVRDNKFIKDLLIFYAIFFFLLVPVAFLTPLMVARSFGDDVWRLTANEVAFFLGSIFGGLLISIWKGLENHNHTIAISCSLLGVFTLALGLSKYFSIYLFFMFLSGLIVPFFVAAITTLLQEKVEIDMQGRIFGLTQIVMAGVMPLGMVVVGPVADLVAIESLFILTGFLMALLGIKVFFNKSTQA